MGFLDLVKIYKSEWEEVSSRKFDEAECNLITEATVVPSKYGKSVCFLIPQKGKAFIPLEPISDANIGDKLDVHTLQLVNLKYVGNDIGQKKTNIMRIRTASADTQVEVTNFDNPFGL